MPQASRLQQNSAARRAKSGLLNGSGGAARRQADGAGVRLAFAHRAFAIVFLIVYQHARLLLSTEPCMANTLAS
jgi:hypothetical protein